MSNHLIIGLGGTGGSVIREFRKRIYEEFNSNSPEGVNIEYIYLDSSTADLAESQSWKVMGHSVALESTQCASTHGVNSDLLTNTRKYPGVEAFLKPNEIAMLQRDSNMVSLINSGIGGQRRRLGRMLIANNMSNENIPDNFYNVLTNAVTRLHNLKGGDENITFHICAGLAGGTGSGSIVDVVSQIRSEYPSVKVGEGLNVDWTYKIRIFAYMPERNVANPDFAKGGFYQANGYAALSEINALSVGTYNPVDVSGKPDIGTGKVRRLLKGVQPFEACYVYSNVNEAGKIFDIKNDLPTMVANFLFQTIVVPEKVGTQGRLARLVGCENEGVGAEEDRAGRKVHGRQFLTFGITRVNYPETEVYEYATYSYAEQAALQIAYNHYVEGQGYSKCTYDEIASGFYETLQKDSNLGIYMLDEEHLKLSMPIISNESSEKWKSLEKTWEAFANAFAANVQKNFQDKKLWVREFSTLMRKAYDSDIDEKASKFRGTGVVKFYSLQKEKELSGMANHISRHIESLLFKEWQEGKRSMLEVEKCLSLLIQNTEERMKQFEQRSSSIANDKLPQLQQKVKEVRDQYDNIGWLKDAITGASGKIFNQFQTALKEYYFRSTEAEALKFAKMLLQEVAFRLNATKEKVKECHLQVDSIIENVLDEIASKCNPSEDQTDTVLKRYDPNKVRTIVKQYMTSKNEQISTTSAAKNIREKLVSMLGENAEVSFGLLNKMVDYDSIRTTMFIECGKIAKTAMENTAASDSANRMTNVNILEKLKQELVTPEKMKEFVSQVVKMAKPCVQFNPTETADGVKMMKMIQLSIPEPTSTTQEFREKLIEAFANNSDGYPVSKSDVSVHYKENEIVVVTAASGFPLRYLANMTTLKEKYDSKVSGPDGEYNRMLLHTESFADFDKVFPALFNKSVEELQREMLPVMMLAYAFGLITEQTKSTGERFACYRGINALGVEDDLPIPQSKADNFGLTWNAVCMEPAIADRIKQQVDIKLKNETRSNTQRAEIKEKLVAVLQNEVLNSLCDGDKYHEDYERYTNIVADIIKNNLQEL